MEIGDGMKDFDEVTSTLNDLKFYKVLTQNGQWPVAHFLNICTYRPKKTVMELFKDLATKDLGYIYQDVEEYNIFDVINLISCDKMWFPIYCVETQESYNSLNLIAEDIMIYRLSGLMDKEMEGMQRDRQD